MSVISILNVQDFACNQCVSANIEIMFLITLTVVSVMRVMNVMNVIRVISVQSVLRYRSEGGISSILYLCFSIMFIFDNKSDALCKCYECCERYKCYQRYQCYYSSTAAS